MASKVYILSRLDRLEIKSYPVVSSQTQYLDKNNASVFYEGEWFTFNSAGTHVQRATSASQMAFLMFYEQNGIEPQVMPEAKVPLIKGDAFDLETNVCDFSNISVGDVVTVGTITLDSASRSALVKYAESSVAGDHVDFIYGVAMRKKSDTIVFRIFGSPTVHIYSV